MAGDLVAGTVLQCGATDYWAIGRTKETRPEYPCLNVPHKLKELEDVKITFIAAGSAACHSVAVDVDGGCYVWGRNEKGQLGLGDQLTRNVPTKLEGLKDHKIVSAACGRYHTVFLTDKGESYACGLNSYGQCGTGSVKKVKGGEDVILTPQRCEILNCSKVCCGGEFTMWLCDGALFSAGLPQYGQLGHGTDNQYNAADSSVKMVFDPQPSALRGCVDMGIWRIWRLGHKVQQDEFKPRLVETLTGRIKIPEDAIVAAGATSTFCTMVGGQLFAWGKLKTSGDNLMYPVPYMELAGWDIKSFSCGATTFGCSASADGENSTITWGGTSGFGELGYGEGGKKSSANPDKCLALEAQIATRSPWGKATVSSWWTLSLSK
eukprot:jgi/Picre1/30114/NNA_005483.t1